MSQHVGSDVSSKEVSIFFVDEDGKVLNRAPVPTEAATVAEYLVQKAPYVELRPPLRQAGLLIHRPI